MNTTRFSVVDVDFFHFFRVNIYLKNAPCDSAHPALKNRILPSQVFGLMVKKQVPNAHHERVGPSGVKHDAQRIRRRSFGCSYSC